MTKDQSIMIEDICIKVTRRRKKEKPIPLQTKKDRLYVICLKKNLTGSLRQLIERILCLND